MISVLVAVTAVGVLNASILGHSRLVVIMLSCVFVMSICIELSINTFDWRLILLLKYNKSQHT